ncbi:MAG: aldehyde dehydrogenase family protein [bacterium]
MANVQKFLLGGQWRTSRETIDIRNPYNGQWVSTVALAGKGEAELALQAAARAFHETRKVPVYRRVEIFQRILQGISERRAELARTITLESGKPISASLLEVDRCLFNFTCAMEESKRIGGEVIPADLKPWGAGRFALTQRFPVGPVLGIGPFNFPLNLCAHKVAPALAAGNSLILKPPSACPGPALKLGEIVSAAGAPDGWLNVIPCRTEVAEIFVRDDRIRRISFTGSTAAGYRVKSLAGKKPVILELGGNAAVIVHEDAPQELAAARIAAGGYGQAGQSCIAVQRVFIHEPIYGSFLDRLVEATGKVRVGDPLDPETVVGPMITERDAVRVEEWVQAAVEEGARILTGGKREGAIYLPTILADVRPAMKVSCEELFAPVITIERYRDFEDAVRRVNDSRYGLQAGIFTQDIGRIFSAFKDLEAGGVLVNEVPTFRMDHLPYGGVKDSGLGREGARYAIEETTEVKALILRLPEAE